MSDMSIGGGLPPAMDLSSYEPSFGSSYGGSSDGANVALAPRTPEFRAYEGPAEHDFSAFGHGVEVGGNLGFVSDPPALSLSLPRADSAPVGDIVGDVITQTSRALGGYRSALGESVEGLTELEATVLGGIRKTYDARIAGVEAFGRGFAVGQALGSDRPFAELVKVGAGEVVSKVLDVRHGAEALSGLTVASRLGSFARTSVLSFAAEKVIGGVVDGIADAPGIHYAEGLSLNDMLRQNARTERQRFARESEKAGLLGLPGSLISSTYHGLVADLTAVGTAAKRGIQDSF